MAETNLHQVRRKILGKLIPRMAQEYKAAEKPDNAYDVQQYAGKDFITERGSKYSVTGVGTFEGRSSIDGSRIEMIGGLNLRDASAFADYLAVMNRKTAGNILKNFGAAVRPGLCLALLITKDDEKKTGRIGFRSSRVVEIRDSA